MSDSNDKEVRLDALVSKLHTEGVRRGEAEAGEIIRRAEEEAAEIRRKATEEAEAMVNAAKSQAEEFERNAVASIRIASRDTMLALNRGVRDLFERGFGRQLGKVLDEPTFLKELISALARDWAGGKGVTVSVRPELGEDLLKVAKSGLESILDEGIEIRLNRSITNGFRIRREGDQVAYDFSDESVVEALKVHLSPQLIELLEL